MRLADRAERVYRALLTLFLPWLRMTAASHSHPDEGGVGMEPLLKDLAFAVRQLVRRPGFTAVALALGVASALACE
ncbi:MAG: hypothetical protein EXR95_07340 [Gemmatimonadetes bacterium]|nr:hypothetical protein [Gemmatimonadota bacterium]